MHRNVHLIGKLCLFEQVTLYSRDVNENNALYVWETNSEIVNLIEIHCFEKLILKLSKSFIIKI